MHDVMHTLRDSEDMVAVVDPPRQGLRESLPPALSAAHKGPASSTDRAPPQRGLLSLWRTSLEGSFIRCSLSAFVRHENSARPIASYITLPWHPVFNGRFLFYGDGR